MPGKQISQIMHHVLSLSLSSRRPLSTALRLDDESLVLLLGRSQIVATRPPLFLLLLLLPLFLLLLLLLLLLFLSSSIINSRNFRTWSSSRPLRRPGGGHCSEQT